MATDDFTFYVVSMTPEDAPHSKPTRACLCEYHYLQAASCLMIRRVLRVLDQTLSPGVLECKFCN